MTYLPWLVVSVAIGEHSIPVIDAFLSAVIVCVLHPLLDGTHIHGVLDDFVIILEYSTSWDNHEACVKGVNHAKSRGLTDMQVELDGIDRCMERPRELVLPESLEDHPLQVLQLVGDAARLGGHGGGNVHGHEEAVCVFYRALATRL